MSNHIELKRGERIFINGSVIKADQNMSFEVTTDTPYLREQDILQVEDTTTPLRQLYFIIQTMVLDPDNKGQALPVFDGMLKSMRDTYSTQTILDGLASAEALVARDRAFVALSTVRELIPVEDSIFGFVPDKVVYLQEAG